MKSIYKTIIITTVIILIFIAAGFGIYFSLDKYYNRQVPQMPEQILTQQKTKMIELEKKSKLSIEESLNLAGCYMTLQQYDKAIDVCQKLTTVDNRAYWCLALTYDDTGNYKQVIINTNQILNDYPKLPEEKLNTQMQLFYQLRAKANWKLKKYKDWFINICKALKYAVLDKTLVILQ